MHEQLTVRGQVGLEWGFKRGKSDPVENTLYTEIKDEQLQQFDIQYIAQTANLLP